MRTFEKSHLLSGIYDVLKCSEFVLNGEPDYYPFFGNDILTNTQLFCAFIKVPLRIKIEWPVLTL